MKRGIPESSRIIPGSFALSVGDARMPAPPGWQWRKLTDLARLETGHTPSREHPEYWDGEIPWIGIPDARRHHGMRISSTAQTVTPEGLANSAARLLPAGTVCLSRTASVGYVTVMSCPMATSQDFVNWVCGPELDPDFLMHLFLSESASLRRFGQGSTHTTIYFPEVQAFRVCAPPIGEQRRIAARLIELRERAKLARSVIEAIPADIGRLRQSTLAAAFRGDLTADWRAAHPDVEPASELLKRIRAERRRRWEEAELARLTARGRPPADDRWRAKYCQPAEADIASLPQLPRGWTWASLGELAWDAGYGTSEKCFADASGVTVLRIPNVVGGQIDLTDLKCTQYESSVSASEILSPGDLLVVRTNGSLDLVGRGALVEAVFDRPTSFASYLVRFRLVSSVARWVGAVWRSPHVRALVQAEAASSAGQHNISLSTMFNFCVPLASDAEMVKIMNLVASAEERLRALTEPINAAAAGLDEIEAQILEDVFRGRHAV